MMRYISQLFTLVCLLFWTSSELAARHIVGGEMTYECLGQDPSNANNQLYRITMIVYRDCAADGTSQQGALFDSDLASPTTGFLTVYQGASTTPFITNFQLGQPVVTPVIPNIGNPCLVLPPALCVQRGDYVFELSLPISTEGYTITYARCCRNPTINNIIEPGEIGMTFFIEITPEAQTLCNSSPVFDEFPPIVLCVDEPFELPMGATDQEGDRLVYYLCSPIVGGGDILSGAAVNSPDGVTPNPEVPPALHQNVDFLAPGFTAQLPLGAGADFIYNDSTGLLSGTPEFQGQFVVGICIDEFRGDTLLSSTKREFQFNITSCERTVDAMIQDDSITADGVYLINICGPGDFDVINESTQAAFIETYNWYLETPDGDSITASSIDLAVAAADTGQYTGIMILNQFGNFANCRDTAEFEINIFPDLRADFSFAYDTCVAGPVTFTDLSESDDPDGIASYAWNFQDGSPSVSTTSPLHLYSVPGNFPVSLSITDFNSCTNTVTNPVNYFPAPPVLLINPDAGSGCEPQDVTFINNSVPIDSTYDYVWEFGDGGTSNQQNPIYVYQNAGIYDVYLAVTSPIGCFIDTTFNQFIEIREAPTAGFSFSPEMPSNLVRDVDFFDESLEAINWRYRIGDVFQTNQRNFTYTFRDTGLVAVTQYVTHPSGCIDSLTKLIDIEPIITFFAPNAFSPNGDGLNDVFIPKAFLFGYKAYRFTVWNQWGQLIFRTEDPTEGWDGTFEGRDSPGGGYLWEAEIIGPRNQIEQYKGTAVLLR
jgi:gliding motility-associated-like protein